MVLVALLVLMMMSPVNSIAEEETQVLTSDEWKSTSGITLILDTSGAATIVNSQMSMDGTWVLNNTVLTITYELYGTRTMELTLSQQDDLWMLTNADGALFLRKSEYDVVQSEANRGLEGYKLSFGEEVVLPFIKFTVEKAELVDTIGGEKAWYPSPEGMRFFRIKAEVENTYGGELEMGRLRSQFVFNGEYTYTGDVRMYTTSGMSLTLSPKSKAELSIYATIPDAMIDQLQTAAIDFSFNDNFASVPTFVADGEYIFHLDVDAEMCNAAKAGPTLARVTFKECPALPTPLSFAQARETGSHTSSFNNKVTDISYSFAPMKTTESVEKLRDLYLEKLSEEGFTVKKNGTDSIVYAGKTKIATVSISSSNMKIKLEPGKDKVPAPTASDKKSASTEDVPETVRYAMGDTITSRTAKISIEKLNTPKKFYSDLNGKSKFYHYIDSTSGDPLLVASGTFKNTGTQPVDIINIYAAFIIDDTYSYRAEVTGAKSGASDFIRDVSPMASVHCYIYSEVPKSIEQNAKSIVLKLGFTDNFDYKVVSSGSLPQFDYCDEVFEIELRGGKKKPSKPQSDSGKNYTDSETIKMVQQALNDAGYNCGNPDGTMGKKTEAAIKEYQAANGLKQTGKIDDTLIKSIEAAAEEIANIIPDASIWGITPEKLKETYKAEYKQCQVGEAEALRVSNIKLYSYQMDVYYVFGEEVTDNGLSKIAYVLSGDATHTDSELDQCLQTMVEKMKKVEGKPNKVKGTTTIWKNKKYKIEIGKGKLSKYTGSNNATVAIVFK